MLFPNRKMPRVIEHSVWQLHRGNWCQGEIYTARWTMRDRLRIVAAGGERVRRSRTSIIHIVTMETCTQVVGLEI